MNRSEGYTSTAGNSWIQTTLYELVDSISAILGAGEEHRVAGIMLDLGNTRRLRPSQRWARIMFVSPVHKGLVAADLVAAPDPAGHLVQQDANPTQ